MRTWQRHHGCAGTEKRLRRPRARSLSDMVAVHRLCRV